MNNIKSFNEFVNETYLDTPVNPDALDRNKKKMEKNGYIEVSVITPVEGLKKGDKVLVTATEFGQLEDESLVTCYKDDKEIIVPKKNLEVKS